MPEYKLTAGDGINLTKNTGLSSLEVSVANISQNDIVGLQTSLDQKAGWDHAHNGADGSNTIPISSVTNLQTTLNGKTGWDHAHNGADGSNKINQSSVFQLEEALAYKSAVSHQHTGADASDKIPISSVTNLQTTLNGKADSIHTHDIADVDGLQAIISALPNNFDTISYSESDPNVSFPYVRIKFISLFADASYQYGLLQYSFVMVATYLATTGTLTLTGITFLDDNYSPLIPYSNLSAVDGFHPLILAGGSTNFLQWTGLPNNMLSGSVSYRCSGFCFAKKDL